VEDTEVKTPFTGKVYRNTEVKRTPIKLERFWKYFAMGRGKGRMKWF